MGIIMRKAADISIIQIITPAMERKVIRGIKVIIITRKAIMGNMGRSIIVDSIAIMVVTTRNIMTKLNTMANTIRARRDTREENSARKEVTRRDTRPMVITIKPTRTNTTRNTSFMTTTTKEVIIANMETSTLTTKTRREATRREDITNQDTMMITMARRDTTIRDTTRTNTRDTKVTMGMRNIMDIMRTMARRVVILMESTGDSAAEAAEAVVEAVMVDTINSYWIWPSYITSLILKFMYFEISIIQNYFGC